MGVAQIELPLNPAPRLVLELTAAIKIVDQISFGSDQEIFDLIATLNEPATNVVTAWPNENEPMLTATIAKR